MIKSLLILLMLLLTVIFSQKLTLKDKSIDRSVMIPELKSVSLNIDCFNESIQELKREQEKQEFLLSILNAKKDKNGFVEVDSIIIK